MFSIVFAYLIIIVIIIQIYLKKGPILQYNCTILT